MVGFKANEIIQLGGSILYASVPADDERMNFGIGYGIVTYGSLNHNLP